MSLDERRGKSLTVWQIKINNNLPPMNTFTVQPTCVFLNHGENPRKFRENVQISHSLSVKVSVDIQTQIACIRRQTCILLVHVTILISLEDEF